MGILKRPSRPELWRTWSGCTSLACYRNTPAISRAQRVRWGSNAKPFIRKRAGWELIYRLKSEDRTQSRQALRPLARPLDTPELRTPGDGVARRHELPFGDGQPETERFLLQTSSFFARAITGRDGSD